VLDWLGRGLAVGDFPIDDPGAEKSLLEIPLMMMVRRMMLEENEVEPLSAGQTTCIIASSYV
jgi:hypothetical protein